MFFLAVLPQVVPAEGLSPGLGAGCAAVVVLSSALALAPYLLGGALLTGRGAAAMLRNGSSALLVLYGAASVWGALD